MRVGTDWLAEFWLHLHSASGQPQPGQIRPTPVE